LILESLKNYKTKIIFNWQKQWMVPSHGPMDRISARIRYTLIQQKILNIFPAFNGFLVLCEHHAHDTPHIETRSIPEVNIQKPSQYLLLPPGEGWDEGIK